MSSSAKTVDAGPVAAERGTGGRFERQQSRFRDWVSPADATTDRYHLYVSLACPWAHRTVILRRLKGLERAIGMSIVDPIRDDRGWAFRDVRGATPDPLHGWSSACPRPTWPATRRSPAA